MFKISTWWKTATVKERLKLLRKIGSNPEFSTVEWDEMEQFIKDSLSIRTYDLKKKELK